MGMLIAIGACIAGVVVLGIVIAVILSRPNRNGGGVTPVPGGYPYQPPHNPNPYQPPHHPMPPGQAYPPAPPNQPPHNPNPYPQQPPFQGQ
jgi:hypothetical protein